MLNKTIEKWEEKTLGDICNIGAGNSAPQDKSLFKDGHYPFIRTADVGKIHFGKIYSSTDLLNDEGIKGLKLFKRGTILIPKSGASTFLNHRVKMEIDGYVVSHLATVKGNEKFINDDFLLYYLSTINVQDLIQDQNYPSVNLPIISNIKIKLPPLSKQQRIVGILDETFENIEKAKQNTLQNLNNVKELFESCLDNIFEKSHEEWNSLKISDISLLKQSKEDVKKLDENINVSFVPMEYLGINKKYFNSDKVKPIKELINKYVYFAENDVIMAKITPCFENGKIGIAKNLSNKIGFGSSEYIVFRPEDRVNNEFLYYFLNRDSYRKLGAQNMKGAVGHKRVAKEFIENTIISFPTDIEEQQKIVQQLDELQEQVKNLEQIYEQKIKDLDELKQSILQKAFNGEL